MKVWRGSHNVEKGGFVAMANSPQSTASSNRRVKEILAGIYRERMWECLEGDNTDKDKRPQSQSQ